MRSEMLGPFRYRWDERCFPLGADSLALGAFCTLKPHDRVLDLGCGAGALLLLCARRQEGLCLTGVELDPHAAALARENLRCSALAGEILVGDMGTLALPQADLVVSNPPWYPKGSGDAGQAGRMEELPLSQLCQTAARALTGKGRFALVHQPERLVDLLSALRQAGLEPKRMQLCRRRADKAPYAVLVEAVKGGKSSLTILPDCTQG